MVSQEILIVGIVFAFVTLVVLFGVIGGMFKTWVDRNSKKDITENQEFLAALKEFKEKTDRRLSNLEAIVVDEEPVQRRSPERELPEKDQKSAIELEIENEEKKESSKESGKLRNMLNQ